MHDKILQLYCCFYKNKKRITTIDLNSLMNGVEFMKRGIAKGGTPLPPHPFERAERTSEKRKN